MAALGPATKLCAAMSLSATARSNPGTLRQEVVIDGRHRLVTDDSVDGELNDAQLERLEKVARACPLRRSIEAGIEFVETIERRQHPALRLVAAGGAS
jgi:hypothetical protein